MKKMLCAALALLVLTVSVTAAPPFAEVGAPGNGLFVHTKGEGFDKIEYVFTRTDELLKYAGLTAEQLQTQGAGEITQYVQFDFSTDSTVGFAFADDWDKSELSGNAAVLPGDSLLARVTALDIEKEADQKLIEGILVIDGDLSAAAGSARFKINFDIHTLYARARLCVAYTDAQGESGLIFSPWTEPQAVAANGLSSPVKPGGLEAPVLENGRIMNSYDDERYLEFTASLSSLDRQAAVWGTASFGTPLELELEARHAPDGEWGDAAGDGKTAAEAGVRTVGLNEGEEYTELRGRYVMKDAEGKEVFVSAWSEALIVGDYTPSPDAPEGTACPVCGSCTMPGGMCIWLWGGALLLAAALFAGLVILLLRLRKKAAADD